MTEIQIKEFYVDANSRLSDSDAKKIGPVLYELSLQGGVTTRDVVDAARSPNSPLHSYFEWDDRVAADKWRLEQAREIMRKVKVRYVEAGQPREARAFQVAHKNNPYEGGGVYRSFQVMHGDSAFAAQMMENAMDDLVRWRSRYQPYTQMWIKFGDVFTAVINQISEFEEEAVVNGISADTDEALARLLEWRTTFQSALSAWTNTREQIEFIMQAIASAESSFCKLKEVATKRCIKCKEDFVTLDDGIRTCPKCRQSVTYKTAAQRIEMAEPISSASG